MATPGHPPTASTSLVSFCVGELFHSFTDLEDKIKSYKEQAFCELWKRDARTIAAARKRMGRPMKEELKYYELKYCCIHGGQPFKAKGRGIRSTS
ncbi:hypothetical protein GBAR_LOCUS16243 [Geodia barretti]|uniref:ZSWIM3 N-terminal domain-containing protein n=1 Tax=Geodia barretti TaxID=519541 RepID=A0AA35SF27_GEOBA|nr:hypothetical protein GBAR_LOCUS16243 [Geodia barretti]